MSDLTYPRIDLHCHTAHSSDGRGTIAMAVQAAAAKGIAVLAITNHCPELPGHVWHDSLESLRRMKDEAAQAGAKHGDRKSVV